MSAALRAGYKLTEVGVIPEDWQLYSLREACSKITDGTHDTPKPVRSGVPFLTAIHVKDNQIAYEECSYLTKADHEIIFKRCNPAMGDVLMVNIGAGVATTALVKVDYEFSLKNVALLKPSSERLLGMFLNYSLAHKKAGISQSLLSGGAQPFLSLFQIGEIKIPVPPLPEQRVIATALSNVDALLAKLDALVAKKRDLKVAAMQQLLTGQTRLPGFSGDWEVRRLGDVLSRMANGAVYKPTNSRGIQITRIETIADGTIDYSRTGVAEDSPELERYKIISGDILFSHINSVDHIGKVAIFNGEQPLYHGMNLLLLRTNKDAESNFLYFWFTSLSARRQTRNLAKQAVSQASINTKELKALEILLPPLPEQTAIASILSDMDSELTALEARRDKTRALKQGMMQELLTGRIRLI